MKKSTEWSTGVLICLLKYKARLAQNSWALGISVLSPPVNIPKPEKATEPPRLSSVRRLSPRSWQHHGSAWP